MLIRVLAVGTRMPAWVEAGVEDYTRRLGPEVRLEIDELPLGKRTANDKSSRAVAEEGKRMLAAIDPADYVVALDVTGKSLSTEQLAKWLAERLGDGRDVLFLVGGPDGLAPECLQRANLRLSLSAFTLPHALVRVVLAEQIYRAQSVLKGHPYHRA
ncbi:MAG TPA: 23S rRNA (pseudouridine(1915)-N(3))-methyltransferase RlmH [Steroidobacteraceae bacterium]|nr:23S rRNA (pseudouridine(1915)-N(3))-methyltransferase RlmH [Steroidobacteraceae bacterium]